METLWQDVKYAARTLAKSPGFALFAVAVIALGIAANTAIFRVVDTVLLRALPYSNPESVVMVWEDASFMGFAHNTPAPGNYADWKAQNRVFEDMAGIRFSSFSLTGDGEPESRSCGDALRRDSYRCARLWVGCVFAGGRRVIGVVRSGAAGHARGSDGGVAQ